MSPPATCHCHRHYRASIVHVRCDRWWDPAIRAGEDFTERILAELDAAKAMVVIWTKPKALPQLVTAARGTGPGPSIIT